MTNIVGTPLKIDNESGVSFTLTNDSKYGRVVVAIAAQYNSFTSLDEISLNGVMAAFPTPLQNDGGSCRALVGVWDNDNLPENAGDYPITIDHAPGVHVTVIELENADAANIKTIEGAGVEPAPESFSLDGNQGAFLGLTFVQNIGGDPISTSGDTEFFGDNRRLVCGRVDDGSGGDITIDGASGSSGSFIAFSINSSVDVPILTTNDGLSPGSSLSFTKSNFSADLTGARLEDQSGNVLELSLESQTQATAPSLGTQNYVLFGDVTLEVYNDTESAQTTVSFQPPSSHSYLVTLSENPSNLTENGYLYNWSPDNGYGGAQVISPIEIDSDGNIVNVEQDGTYTLYGVDDFDGMMQTFTVEIGSTSSNINPEFSYSTSLLESQFSNQTTYSGEGTLSYSWDFGDGNTSFVQNPTHTYSSAGTYDVGLTVTDGSETKTHTEQVSVTDVISLTADFKYSENFLKVYFDNKTLYNGNTSLTYSWDFGDNQSSNEESPVHTYNDEGVYTVNLSVTDGTNTDSFSQTIVVSSDDNYVGGRGNGNGNRFGAVRYIRARTI